MEEQKQLGDYLRERRLERGMSLEQVNDETKINTHVLQKIENNEAWKFLSTTHMRGFIVNLCEYYEIDVQEALQLFEADMKLQNKILSVVSQTVENQEDVIESSSVVEVSPEEIAKKQRVMRQLKQLFPVLILLCLIMFGITAYFLFKKSKEDSEAVVENLDRNIYKMNSDQASFDLKTMDMVRIFFDVKYYIYTLRNYENGVISFSIETTTYELKEQESMEIDFNGDAHNDLKVEFRKGNGDLVYIYFQLLDNMSTNYENIWNNQEKVVVGYDYKLLSYSDKIPITVYIKAGSLSSYVSYIIDSSRQNKFTLKSGEDVTIVAVNTLELTLGNYKNARVIVNKIPLNLKLDHDKFSVTKVIKWVKDLNNETKFDLEIKDYVDKNE